MNTHSLEYDKYFDKIDHFKKFPAMRPYVGKNFDNNEKVRVFIIAESNYLPEHSIIHKDANIWFNSSQHDLSNEEINWIDCRHICNSDWESDGHMLYRELERNLATYFIPISQNDRAFTNIAFMNGFQRPSPKTGESIKNYLTQLDYSESSEVISSVISIINPDLVIFVSKLAWDRLKWRLKVENSDSKFDFTCHPATGGFYWNKKTYMHGKEKFRTILSQNINKIT